MGLGSASFALPSGVSPAPSLGSRPITNLFELLNSDEIFRLDCFAARVDRQLSEYFPVAMQVDLVVEVGNDTSVVGNDSHAFAELRFSGGTFQIQDAMFFTEPCDDGLGIVSKQSITVSLARG